MFAGADQEDALRGKQARRTRQRADADNAVTQQDQGGERDDIKQDHPAARILDADLRQKAKSKQANERHVPQLDRAPGMAFE